jgi:hypothetical protein
MSFPVASESNGVAQDHILAIAQVCREQNTFLFVRPSEMATVRLIKQGFATKSMDIHEKSSDWGLHAGLVPQDPALSKLTGTPNRNIQRSAHGHADSVQLQFTQAQYETLKGLRHFDGHTDEFNGHCDCRTRWPGTTHFRSRKMPQICQLMDREGKVYWAPRNPAASSMHEPVPVYVKAYNGTPVTGDYDMWMVAPHVTSLNDSEAPVRSIPDDHGRSAALDFTVQLSKNLNDKCIALIPNSKPVFNHGAEANNLSFTQDMEKKDLVVFCPGNHAPFLIHPVKDPEKLTKLFHDMLRHGYVVMLNPKWKHGFTLGSEDLAFANPEIQMDKKSAGQVASALSAVQQLAAGAATVIQNNWRASRRMAQQKAELRAAQGRPNTGKAQVASAAGLAFLAVYERQQLARLNAMPDEERKAAMTPAYRLKDRAVKLRQFRLITNIPTVGDKDLIADPSMFPYFEATILEHTILAQKTRALQESQFQRTGFAMEGEDGHQHLTPIDEQQAERADDFPYYQALYGSSAHIMWVYDRKRANFVRRKNTGIWPPKQ